ncbi:MAG: hypothetical protein IKU25_01805 [Clostridia bacterium]|nr:hypothetical protein [Clostridia bacterium]
MKKLTIVLAIILVILSLVACGEVTTTQTTTFVSGENSTNISDETTHTTTVNHSPDGVTSATTTENTGGETTTNPDEDSSQGETTAPSDNTTATTKNNGETTTSNKITTTTNKTTTTTTKKTTTTTTKTTTTTTKKTTTTTKKTTTTTKAHSFSVVSCVRTDINSHKVTKKCSVCGTTSTSTEYHTWGAWKFDSQPTSTSPGVKYRTCTGCGEEQVTYVPATSANVANFDEKMLNLINAERKKNGLDPLIYYTAGQTGANTRAKEIMTLFSHNRPDGTKWWTAPGFDKSVCQAGAENIARGYGSPEDVMTAFMNSADHKKNILSTQYTHVVIAYYEGAWVQIFVKLW